MCSALMLSIAANAADDGRWIEFPPRMVCEKACAGASAARVRTDRRRLLHMMELRLLRFGWKYK
jgi:hypothetical protein